ncbi:hypothetical protein [Streptomyces sp. KR80]|uniref:hypothetical protein n=1 Tax=Streptomyces sp. KR80 TaxID=3457426 RepID=UPI003FD04381
MPLPPPSRPPSGPRRRSLLVGAFGAAAAAGLLSGCSDDGRAERSEHGAAARKLRERGARESWALLARYDATAEVHPALADRLAPLRAEVAEHAAALAGPARSGSFAPPTPSSVSPTPPSAPPSLRAGRHGSPPKVPEDEAGALTVLADAERRTADARTTDLLEAPPELARLLASIAAAGAAHAYLLAGGG